MINRFFSDNPLDASMIALEGREFHHLAHVMRLEVGDTVEVVNGQGELAKATISALETSTAILQIESVYRETQKGPEIVIAQAFIHSLEWVIEKGTELGATKFWLFPGVLSDKKQAKDERLKTIT